MGQVSDWKFVTEMEDLCTKRAEEWLSVKNGSKTSFPRTQCCAVQERSLGSCLYRYTLIILFIFS